MQNDKDVLNESLKGLKQDFALLATQISKLAIGPVLLFSAICIN